MSLEAQEKPEKKADAKVEAPAKTDAAKAVAEGAAATKPGSTYSKPGVAENFPEKEFYSKEEVEALRSVLDKKSSELDQDIDTQKKYVESLRTQVNEHLVKIDAARNEIAEFMNAREEREEGKLKKLAKFYEAMEAEQAAPLLKDVADELAIKIFDRMDAKKAGTILAQMPASRAARLTANFPRLKIQADRGGASGKN